MLPPPHPLEPFADWFRFPDLLRDMLALPQAREVFVNELMRFYGVPRPMAEHLLTNAEVAIWEHFHHGPGAQNPKGGFNWHRVEVPLGFPEDAVVVKMPAPKAPPPGPPAEGFVDRPPLVPEPQKPLPPDIDARPPAGADPGWMKPGAGPVENAGKVMIWVTILDGWYRDWVKIMGGGDDPGVIGPLLEGTWVGDGLHWIADHSPMTTGVIRWVDHYSHTGAAIVSVIGTVFQLAEVLGWAIGQGIQAVIDAVNVLVDAVEQAVAWMADQLVQLVELGIDVGLIATDALGEAGDHLADGLVAALPHFDAAVDQAGQALGDAAAAFGNGVPGIVANANATVNAGADLVNAVPNVVVQVLVNGPGGAANAAPGVIQKIETVITHANATVDAGVQAMDNGVQVIVNQAPVVIDHIGNGLDAIGNRLSNAGNALGNGAQEAFDTVTEFFGFGGGGLLGAAPAAPAGVVLMPLAAQLAVAEAI
jgi:hypothetical protein